MTGKKGSEEILFNQEGETFESLMLKFHEMAMSSDPEDAVRGRCAKAIAAAVDRWIEDEAERRSSVTHRLVAASRVFSGVLGMLTLLYARRGYEAEALHCMHDQVNADMAAAVQATIEALREQTGRAAG